MEIEVQLAKSRIEERVPVSRSSGIRGSWIEFRGVVRGEENDQEISALEYEAYPEMAEREMRRLLKEISVRHQCQFAKVIHRVGTIPVGDTAIYVGIASEHRGEGLALLTEFMDRLKRDVPIWKRKGIPLIAPVNRPFESSKTTFLRALLPLTEARAEISARCRTLPAVPASLNDAVGRVLRETVAAKEDLPSHDRSTRDGYAVRQNDSSTMFEIVDTIHAADWKPRQLETGEAVRIATGAALPCSGLRVVMQEQVERTEDRIRITKPQKDLNIRKRGEDMRAGQPIVTEGVRLDAGRLALLATVGCDEPSVSPRLRVIHFTTGDEIVSPDKTPEPGQVRDSNSILVRGLLERFHCDVHQQHLPEDYDMAKMQIGDSQFLTRSADLVLVSGGASVGDKDFTKPLLEWLGFETVFSQVDVRPGRPLIFGADGKRVAFGLPGNPLSHFVCFHLFVAAALAKMVGESAKTFLRGRLATKLEDSPNMRVTMWPARLDAGALHPLRWASSGDITCLTETNALIRVDANVGSIAAGAEISFFPTT